MSERRNNRRDSRLETLYRKSGDVEPDAGLDRIIRARADEAARAGHERERLPWLGGLVTASVAVVAIAVVMQQAPPDESMPESLAPQAPAEPEAFKSRGLLAPSVGADATVDSSAQTRQARGELREMELSEMQSAGEAAQVAPPSAAALSNQGEPVSDERRDALLRDVVAEQAAEVVRERSETRDSARNFADHPGPMLERIEALIEGGNLQRARELLEAFREKYPAHAVPEKIREGVARPE